MSGAFSKKDFVVGEQLAEILDEYSHALDENVEKEINQVAKECAQQLRNTSPKRPGHGEYARSWGVKRDRDGSVTVHNKDHYQLTHLLENGHIIRNKRGTYGRVNGIKHIAPVEQWGNNEVVTRIQTKIERGLI